MIWYAGCGMRCICMICKGMKEPVLNLEIQKCHWKGEVISVEIDIKVTGIGCTVWKWQAKQIWHRSAIISKWPTKCIKINMLKHANMATKYMAGSTQDAWQKLNTELRLIHPLTGSNKHGKSAFGKQISDLVKLTLVWNFRSDSTLRSMKIMLHDLNMAK